LADPKGGRETSGRQSCEHNSREKRIQKKKHWSGTTISKGGERGNPCSMLIWAPYLKNGRRDRNVEGKRRRGNLFTEKKKKSKNNAPNEGRGRKGCVRSKILYPNLNIPRRAQVGKEKVTQRGLAPV